MPIALDFGTCNSVIARWNQARNAVDVVRLDSLSRRFKFRLPGQNQQRDAHVIPSLIHYAEGDKYRVGAQVINAGLAEHRGTFRWIKLDMLRDNRKTKKVNGRLISYQDAASDLLTNILLFAGNGGELDDSLVLTVPVEAYDHYVEWLRGTALGAVKGDITVVDEATACILGYEHRVADGQPYLIFDFGGGTLDVSLVRTNLAATGRDKCRILGRAGEEIGGINIDQWLMQRLAAAEHLSDDDISDVGTALLQDIEEAKIALSSGEKSVDITRFNDISGRMISHTFIQQDLIDLLRDEGVHTAVARTVERALEAANDKYGLKKSQIKGVFMVGGSSLLLGMRDLVATLFPACDVRCESPFDAIAAGACRFAGDADINPTLVHDYCLKAWDREQMAYQMVPVVPKGTQYPTEKAVSAKYVSSACHGGDCLGIVIYERSEMQRAGGVLKPGADGRLRWVQEGEQKFETVKPLNSEDNQFIFAAPPCDAADKKRFIVRFGVDRHKRLTLAVEDTKAGNKSYIRTRNGEKFPLPVKDFPLVKL